MDDDGRRLHDKFAQVSKNSPKGKKNKKIIERSSMNFSLSLRSHAIFNKWAFGERNKREFLAENMKIIPCY